MTLRSAIYNQKTAISALEEEKRKLQEAKYESNANATMFEAFLYSILVAIVMSIATLLLLVSVGKAFLMFVPVALAVVVSLIALVNSLKS